MGYQVWSAISVHNASSCYLSRYLPVITLLLLYFLGSCLMVNGIRPACPLGDTARGTLRAGSSPG